MYGGTTSVHADTSAVAVAEPDGEVRSLGIYPEPPGIGSPNDREAGPGEAAEGLLRSRPLWIRVVLATDRALGVCWEVVAPSWVPIKAGDRVKTDRRDAAKLARSDRAGDRTPVGFRMPTRKPCASWCERAKMRARISLAHATAGASSCGGTTVVRRRT